VSEKLWSEVDDYVCGLLAPHDAALEAAVRDSAAAGLPPIHVTPAQGKLLYLLAYLQRARRILEIGTLGGYSTIWLGRALPAGGRLISLEIDSRHAEVARANIKRAGLSKKVEVRLGRALDTLSELAGERASSFDMVFIDADKESIPEYFEWALRLSRRGGLIFVDNVIRDGEVANASSIDPRVIGVRRFNAMLAKEPRVIATEIQTVGSKGYDGFAIALVK
jgi:predicted O-methyltransferase YrrM